MQSLWMIAAGFLFACMGVCVKLSAAEGHSLAEIVFYRSIVALLMMSILMAWHKVPLPTPHWRWQVKRGVTGFFALLANFFGISMLPLATAMTLNYTSPIFFVLLLVMFRGLKLNAGIAFSMAMGFTGVAFMLHPSFSGQMWLGSAVSLASALLAAMAYFDISDLGRRGEPEVRTVFYFSFIATVASFVWILFSPLHPVAMRGFLMLAGVGVFATLGQLAMTRAYSRGKPFLSASLAYTAVVFATLFGVVLWGDRIGWPEILGMALIMVSSLSANRFSANRKK